MNYDLYSYLGDVDAYGECMQGNWLKQLQQLQLTTGSGAKSVMATLLGYPYKIKVVYYT